MLKLFAPGGYAYAPNASQYSAAVIAAEGHSLVRVRLPQPLPLVEGFAVIEQVLRAAGRPTAALCSCELRAPAPLGDADFAHFNDMYIGGLKRLGAFDGDITPVARGNACPIGFPLAGPSLHAFAYTVRDTRGGPTDFIIAASGESVDGKGSYRENTARLGDTSPDGIRGKTAAVLDMLERRLGMVGRGWNDVGDVQLYTIHDSAPALDEIRRRGAARNGVMVHQARPPIVDLEVLMDCRRVAEEHLL